MTHSMLGASFGARRGMTSLETALLLPPGRRFLQLAADQTIEDVLDASRLDNGTVPRTDAWLHAHVARCVRMFARMPQPVLPLSLDVSVQNSPLNA